MKKVLALILTAAMAASFTACGKKVTESQSAKVEGRDARAVAPANDTDAQKGTIDNVDVSINNAKIIDTDEGKAIMISFTLNNTTSSEQNFDGLFDVDALQNGKELFGANAVMPAEGIDLGSALTMVQPGEKAEVQKFYSLNDEETDVEVILTRAFAPEMGALTKTFSIK